MPILGSLGCCARAANDHITADPTIPAMKSRRRIGPSLDSGPTMFGYKLRPSKQETASSEMGLWVSFAMQKSCAAYDGSGSFASGRRVGRNSAYPPRAAL
jgi:hypothetical protein